nr:PREDICTED: uncharacterized protein LOC105667973 isoform X1 [Linepithema humile]
MENNIEHLYNSNYVQMTKNMVWFCGNCNLFAYNRAMNGSIESGKKIMKRSDTFITSFAHCNNYIIGGTRDGHIYHWEIEDNQNNVYFEIMLNVEFFNCYYEIQQINATSQHIITGCDNSINILKYTDDRKGYTKEKEIIYGDDESMTNWLSISFDPIGTKFAANSINSFDYYSYSSFHIYDIDKNYQIMNIKYDDLCQQLIWEDTHTILMCFENFIKKMDLRTSEFVRTWDSSKYDLLFCCSSDNMNTFMTGHYMGVLWDQRQSVAIQTYDVDDSGICSLEFDSTHMYAATETDLFELDFTGKDHFDHKKIENFFSNFY